MADPSAKIASVNLVENANEHVLTISTSTVIDGVTHTSKIVCHTDDYIFHGVIPTAEAVKKIIVDQANKRMAIKALAAELKMDVDAQTDLVAQADKGK